MLRVVKNVTLRQNITNEVLYAALPRISTTIRERRLRFWGHCCGSKNEVVSDLICGNRSMAKGAWENRLTHFFSICRAAMDDRIGWRKRAMGGGGGGGGGRVG